mgnify:CR=1 FL=1
MHGACSQAFAVQPVLRIAERLPWFIGAVILLSFLLLMVEFKSIFVPLKAAVMNVLSIAAADNPYSFLGGVCLVLPVLGYAVAEWVGWYRPRPSLSRPLGVLNLLAAVVLVLGGVGNVGAALRADEPRDLRFIVALGAGFGLAAAYLAYSGWRRLHHFAPSAPTQ